MIQLIVAVMIFTVLSGCEQLPPAPEVYQCAYSVKFNKFRCVSTATGKGFNVSRDDVRMEGAQCLSREDYRKISAWVDSVIEIARRRCQ